ncbi:tetratricopeptide repeat-containing serine protease family protein [Dolichospermum circinale]|uniref:tetratricopeptide repeat-containing S1 family peptidase n=1 Tax=Dolichospermum circinale TaxID=109265 RepID=UPI00232BAE65|nr:serine protease [Dolichospermum circinale]MDB9455931.1 trypsin-like peptidase domain-containing protein [Dolichospermum circinale CS-541/06]MDB9461321.1 trypsin-like peptidase domain-containing protein [Dolichospermum circinale CS-541/04]MDB9546353.1 trypsin-like peptidase domain-containing protein [Dolichospermum circinale CS-1031]
MKNQIVFISSLLILLLPTLSLANIPNYTREKAPTKSTCDVNPENISDNGVVKYSQKQLEAIANQITVKVIGDNNYGSGTILSKQGNSYLILTNSHLLLGVNYDKIKITTPDGQQHKAEVITGSLNNLERPLDIALLKFTSDQQYCQPMRIANYDISKYDTRIMSAGYSINDEKIRFNQGVIGKISPKMLKKGYTIGYTGDVQQGMSGGPIISHEGQLIGINSISSHPISNSVYVYHDEKEKPPTSDEIQRFRKLNWGIATTTFLMQVKPEIITAYNLPIPDTTEFIKPIIAANWLKKLEENAKQITVKIDRSSGGNGSGVIVAKKGCCEYTVLTAAHVLKEKIKAQNLTYKIITPDNKKHDVFNNIIFAKNDTDLAVVKFQSAENYQVANLGNYEIQHGQYVLSTGYPLKQSWYLSLGQTDSTDIGSKIVEKDFVGEGLTGGYELVYNNITFGGMSGGPILDIQGRVIGIHGRAEGEGNQNQSEENIQLGYSLGIPIRTFLKIAPQLNTQIKNIETTPPQNTNKEEVENALLIDIPKTNTSPEKWLERANHLWRLKHYEDAVNASNEVIQQNSQKPLFLTYAYYIKGKSLASQNKNEEAIEAFKQSGQYTRALYNLSVSYQESKQLDEALSTIDEAIKFDPKNASFYDQRGSILEDLGKIEEAKKSFDTSLSINPRRHTELRKTITELRSEIEKKPEDPHLYQRLGLAYRNLRLRKLDQANLEEFIQGKINHITIEIEKKPEDPNLYQARGFAYNVFKENDLAQAKAQANFKKSRELVELADRKIKSFATTGSIVTIGSSLAIIWLGRTSPKPDFSTPKPDFSTPKTNSTPSSQNCSNGFSVYFRKDCKYPKPDFTKLPTNDPKKFQELSTPKTNSTPSSQNCSNGFSAYFVKDCK